MDYQKIIQIATDKLFIIGEAGVNHDGSLEKAKKLVDVALEAGCDAVKFQTWITEKVYSRKLSPKPEYMLRTTDHAETEFDVVKKNELSFDAFRELKRYCDKKGILFFSTPDETDSANFLLSIGQQLFKVASQDVTNIPFLQFLARQNVPVIFSTGGCTLLEMTEAIDTLLKENNEIILFHTVSAYPAPIEEMNLKMISTLSQLYGKPVGFSDHTLGYGAACAALAFGARIFEKHFTLDRDTPGPDHQASLNPEELRNYVLTLRSVYRGLGDGLKKVMPCEVNVRSTFRRFLVTDKAIKKGEIFSEQHFCFKKMSDGIAPKELSQIVGRKALFDLPEDEPLMWEFVE